MYRRRLAYSTTRSRLETNFMITSFAAKLMVGYPLIAFSKLKCSSASSSCTRVVKAAASSGVTPIALSRFASPACRSEYARSTCEETSNSRSARINLNVSSWKLKISRRHANLRRSNSEISLEYEAITDRSLSSQRLVSMSDSTRNGKTASNDRIHSSVDLISSSVDSLDSFPRHVETVISLFVIAIRSKDPLDFPRYSKRVGRRRCGCVFDIQAFHIATSINGFFVLGSST